jgi:hypothetical protein
MNPPASELRITETEKTQIQVAQVELLAVENKIRELFPAPRTYNQAQILTAIEFFNRDIDNLMNNLAKFYFIKSLIPFDKGVKE